MPLLTLAVLGLMLLGTLLGTPAPVPSQEPRAASAPQPVPVALTPELSEPMFHGTVDSIDPAALRVTIRTDFGRLVPVAIASCDLLRRLQIGDRVRLDVDPQGVVRALDKTGAVASTAPTTLTPSAEQAGRCPETAT